MFRPFSAALFLMLSGVSPWAICQAIVPLFMSSAVMRPYGGLTSGRPCTVRLGPPSPPPRPPPCAGAAGMGAPASDNAAAGVAAPRPPAFAAAGDAPRPVLVLGAAF